jgi:branched-chain amino acid transport system substrate-binding protein
MPGSATTPDRVKIVSSLTRSGSSRGQSDSIVAAIRMRLDDADWRVAGLPVVYEDLDGGSAERGSWDPVAEAANARRAAADPEVLAYIGTLDADAAPFSIPILNQAGPLLMISPCNTYPGLTVAFEPGEPDVHYPTGTRNYARTAVRDDRQGKFAAAWAHEVGARQAVVLHDGEPYGRGVALPFADELAALGVRLPMPPLEIERKRADYRELAAAVASAQPDLVFYGGIIQNGAGPLWRALRPVLPQVTLMGADALFERAFIQDAGEAAEGTLITFAGIAPELLTGSGARFVKRYQELVGSPPESYAASAYDAVGAVLAGIDQAGPSDRAVITRVVLSTRDFDGLLGRWSFDANGDIDLDRGTRLVVAGGHFVVRETAPLGP